MPTDPITEIRIRGYKSLANETRLEIRPLTILAGANSSGKSSAMQPLLLLKQTFASSSDPGVMEIAGPNVSFSSYHQMFSRVDDTFTDSMKFGFSIGDERGHHAIDLHYQLGDHEILLQRQDRASSGERGNESFSQYPGPMSEERMAQMPSYARKFLSGPSSTFNEIQKLYHKASHGLLHFEAEGSILDFRLNFLGNSDIRDSLLNLIHIPGLRGNRGRGYVLRRSDGPRFDGMFEDYVAGLIARRNPEQLGRIGRWLCDLGLTWKVEAEYMDSTRAEIWVGRLNRSRPGAGDDVVNIADVGFGVSQILPALVAMEAAEENQLIHLEQPELHLHPRAQRSLADLFAEAAKKGVRLVIETHSSILLLGVQTLVAKGKLDPKLVKLHWFTRDEETGVTKVDSADLDENGAFGSGWPADFDDTYLDSEGEYLDAVEKRNAR